MMLFTIIIALLQGQSPEGGLYWVFFSDRGPGLESRLEEADLRIQNGPSLARRVSAGHPEADVYDLSPWAPYVETVESMASEPVRVESRFLNAVSVRLTPQQVQELENSPFVRELRPVGVSTFTPDVETPAPDSYGLSRSQLQQIDVLALHQRGWTGSGVVLGVLDTGFELDHPCFQYAVVLDSYDFVKGDSVVAWQEGDPQDQASHGTRVLSMIAGYDPELYLGGAFNASFLLAKTEDTGDEYEQEEDFWVAGLEWLETRGADLVSSSLGYSDWYEPYQLDGNTAVTTIAADIAASRGLLVFNSAGNDGPGDTTLVAPADGDSVFAAGAVDGGGMIADFSSRGPTADGRIKPDGCARGNNAVAASYSGTGYSTVNGTSFAAPLVSSAAGCISSAHPDWSMMRIYEALRSTSDIADDPDNSYGYGVIDALAAIKHRSVIGQVRRSDTADPLSGLHVTVTMESGTVVETVTNDAGCFAVEPGVFGNFEAVSTGWGQSIPVVGTLGEQGIEVTIYVDPVNSAEPPSAYPNPSAEGFYIGFDVTVSSADVSLSIFTVSGNRIHYQSRESVPQGCYRAPVGGEAFFWNGNNENDEPAASGQYVAMLRIGDSVELMNLALIRGMEEE